MHDMHIYNILVLQGSIFNSIFEITCLIFTAAIRTNVLNCLDLYLKIFHFKFTKRRTMYKDFTTFSSLKTVNYSWTRFLKTMFQCYCCDNNMKLFALIYFFKNKFLDYDLMCLFKCHVYMLSKTCQLVQFNFNNHFNSFTLFFIVLWILLS